MRIGFINLAIESFAHVTAMETESQFSYTHSAEYSYIDFALKAHWDQFQKLEEEFRNFVPLQISDFSERRKSDLISLKKLNPISTDESLLELIDRQIAGHASLPMQLHSKFGDRIMSEYVTIAFLSHALCEALINAILAIGLSKANAPELFEMLERSDIKEKWCIGPKSFHAPYTFPKNAPLYQTLQHLTRQRNALVHYKIELEMRGKPVLRGSRLEAVSYKEQLAWIGRYFSLPYDLAAHVSKEIPELALMLIFDRSPIRTAAQHNTIRIQR